MFNEGILDNEKNGFDNLRILTAYYYKLRNMWVEDEKKLVESSDYRELYKSNAIDLLNKYKTSTNENLDLAKMDIEQNNIDFYAAVALGSKNLGSYYPSENYSRFRAAMNSIIINSFKEKNELITAGSSIDEPVETIINYWYLFESGDQNFNPGLYLCDYFKSEYSLVSIKRMILHAGTSYYLLKETFKIHSQNSFIPNEPEMGEVSNLVQLNASYSYRFLLSEETRFAAFITFSLMGG